MENTYEIRLFSVKNWRGSGIGIDIPLDALALEKNEIRFPQLIE